MALSLLDLPITIIQDIAKFLCPHCHPQQRERDDFASPCMIRCRRLGDGNATLAELKGLRHLEELRINFGSMLPTPPDYWDEEVDEDGAEGEWDGEEDGDGDDDAGDDDDGYDLDADVTAELTDLLPPSICLLHWEGRTLPSVLGLGALCKCCKARYPSLKLIFLDYHPAWLRLTLPDRYYVNDVREAMAGTGIEVRFRV